MVMANGTPDLRNLLLVESGSSSEGLLWFQLTLGFGGNKHQVPASVFTHEWTVSIAELTDVGTAALVDEMLLSRRLEEERVFLDHVWEHLRQSGTLPLWNLTEAEVADERERMLTPGTQAQANRVSAETTTAGGELRAHDPLEASTVYIHKRRVAVRVSQFGHDPIDGYFCLALEAETRNIPRSILELLNSPVQVIPFIVGEDDAVTLLTRLNVDWVIAGERVPSELIRPALPTVAHEEPVELEFMNGTTIRGFLQVGQRVEPRASDFLNYPEAFYPVRTQMGMLLVNKHRVRETRLGLAVSQSNAA